MSVLRTRSARRNTSRCMSGSGMCSRAYRSSRSTRLPILMMLRTCSLAIMSSAMPQKARMLSVTRCSSTMGASEMPALFMSYTAS